MPRRKQLNNLDDYGRTRRWELLKRMRNNITELRDHQADRSDSSDDEILELRNPSNLNLMQSSAERIPGNDDDHQQFIENTSNPEEDTHNDDSINIDESNINNDMTSQDSENSNESNDSILSDRTDITEDNDNVENDEMSENNNENDGPFNDDDRSSSDEESEDNETDGDLPVYEGAPISLSESMLSVFAFAQKSNLTGVDFANLLELISLHMRPGSSFPKTTHKFMKYFEKDQTTMKRHHYCSECKVYLEDKDTPCSCTSPTKLNYFIEIPIFNQLQKLMCKPGFVDDVKYQFQHHIKTTDTIIRDIYNGSVYKNHLAINNQTFSPYTLSFMWYTDGAPIFKSRKCSVWPLYFIINELPYEKRILKENIVVAGIWFGSLDPIVNLYLLPIYTQLADFNVGKPMKIFVKVVKAFLICGTADSPARADFLNHTHHNGRYVCLGCLASGYTIRDENFGNALMYPFEGLEEARTHEEHRNHVHAVSRDGPLYGIKGPSILMQMMPDIIHGTAIDIMHCVYLGVVKKLIELWIEAPYRYHSFSLYNYRDIIDERLLSLKPPNFIKRMPRSLVHNLKYLKASELKTWFYFYSAPLLADLMATDYFDHYTQLLHGIYILNQESITVEQLNHSKQLLTAFVAKFQALYDPRFMSYNLHLLHHLPEVVEQLGPLWVTSCFPFEDLLGRTVDYVHGTRYVGLQIYSKIAKNMIISHMLYSLNDDSNIKKYCKKLTTVGKRINGMHEIMSKTYALGEMVRLRTIPPEIEVALINIPFVGEQLININVYTFKRLKKKTPNYIRLIIYGKK